MILDLWKKIRKIDFQYISKIVFVQHYLKRSYGKGYLGGTHFSTSYNMVKSLSNPCTIDLIVTNEHKSSQNMFGVSSGSQDFLKMAITSIKTTFV